jgi:uncharacterized membrane protein
MWLAGKGIMMRDLFGFGGCWGGSWKVAIVLAAVGGAGEALAATLAYSVMTLPQAEARLLNNRGDVVLYSGGSDQHYIFNEGSGMKALPVPEEVSDLLYLNDINDAGQVVANYFKTNTGPQSAVFEPDGRIRTLNPTDSASPYVYHITNDGRVFGEVMFSRMEWPSGSSEGIAYDHVPISPDHLVTLFAGSDTGDMAGYAYVLSTASFVPAVVRNRVEMLLPTNDRQFGWAQSMSEDGRWIGGFLEFGFDQDEVPVRWRDDVLEELKLPKGAANAGLSGINNDGVGVGVAAANGVLQATIWDAEGAPHLVADVVQTEQAWYFETAVAINNCGQIIGNGYTEVSPGVWDYRGYLLTPIPEPGGVVGLALVGGWAMRRRRNSDLRI